MHGRFPEPLEKLPVSMRWDPAMLIDKSLDLIQYALDMLSNTGID
jgi:hypothetical protein